MHGLAVKMCERLLLYGLADSTSKGLWRYSGSLA